MKKHMRHAVVARLTNDEPLGRLLAPNPNNAGLPMVLLEDGKTRPSAYPCITYRFTNGVHDPAFAPTMVEGGGESKVQEFRLEVRCYGEKGVDERDDISAQVTRLFAGVAIPFTGGRIHQTACIGEVLDQPDAFREARFHMLRFLLRVVFT